MSRGSDPPVTPDGRYIVVRGRLWRATNPHLPAERRQALVDALMDARRAVGQAKRAGDKAAEDSAHAAVDSAKRALGERGEPWWSDGAPDFNRRLVRNSDYAAWHQTLVADAAPPARIGTAGWSIPKDAAADFSDTGTHLERYGAVMSAVEINSSFYRPHRPATYVRWAASVPTDFRFSVKIPKAISHDARLVGTEDLMDAFLDQAGNLGERLGVLLLQLPPSLAYAEDVVPAFLAMLRHKLPAGVDIACEPRHVTWFARDADACLAEHRVARVAADPVLALGGDRPGGWAGLRYHRLHGAPQIYRTPYDATQIATMAESLAAERAEGAQTWCIFDNTASGAATGNAVALRGLL